MNDLRAIEGGSIKNLVMTVMKHKDQGRGVKNY